MNYYPSIDINDFNWDHHLAKAIFHCPLLRKIDEIGSTNFIEVYMQDDYENYEEGENFETDFSDYSTTWTIINGAWLDEDPIEFFWPR